MKWIEATKQLPEPFKVVVCKYTSDSPDPRRDTELHWNYVDGDNKWAHYKWENYQVEWLDEQDLAENI